MSKKKIAFGALEGLGWFLMFGNMKLAESPELRWYIAATGGVIGLVGAFGLAACWQAERKETKKENKNQ